MVELDATHPTVAALQRLVPEAIVAGGSFAAWLPSPHAVSPSERAATLSSAQDTAVKQCVERLLRLAGFAEGVEVRKTERGERDWPAGFVGSLTHKGTVVLGVIAKRSSTPMVGIDLERMDRADLIDIQKTIASEGLPYGFSQQLGILFAFSAKEAVFKAQYPQTQKWLGFSDVNLVWVRAEGDHLRAAVCGGVTGLEVRCMRVDRWVLAAAIG